MRFLYLLALLLVGCDARPVASDLGKLMECVSTERNDHFRYVVDSNTVVRLNQYGYPVYLAVKDTEGYHRTIPSEHIHSWKCREIK